MQSSIDQRAASTRKFGGDLGRTLTDPVPRLLLFPSADFRGPRGAGMTCDFPQYIRRGQQRDETKRVAIRMGTFS